MLTTTMSAAQRTRATLEFKPTDRVPTFVLAISCEVASKLLGRPALTGTGELHYYEVRAWAQGDQAHADFEAQLDRDMLDIHRLLDLDVYHPPWRFNVRPSRQIDEYTFQFGGADPQEGRYVYQFNPVSGDFACIEAQVPAEPLEERIRRRVEQLESPDAVKRVARAKETVELQQRLGDEFVLAGGGCGVSVGIDADAMEALLLYPDLMERQTMAQARDGVAYAGLLVRNLPITILFGGGDLAGKTGPMYSPDTFRRITLPAYRHLAQHLGALGAHYVFRSDGDVWLLADMLFREAGCPGFGEIDRDAGMDARRLRERFPNLALWGNVSSALLASGTVQQVRDQARRILDETGGRGYFQGCSNAIVKGTPPENIIALYETR